MECYKIELHHVEVSVANGSLSGALPGSYLITHAIAICA
jgi:hypothetical protein